CLRPGGARSRRTGRQGSQDRGRGLPSRNERALYLRGGFVKTDYDRTRVFLDAALVERGASPRRSICRGIVTIAPPRGRIAARFLGTETERDDLSLSPTAFTHPERRAPPLGGEERLASRAQLDEREGQ